MMTAKLEEQVRAKAAAAKHEALVQILTESLLQTGVGVVEAAYIATSIEALIAHMIEQRPWRP